MMMCDTECFYWDKESLTTQKLKHVSRDKGLTNNIQTVYKA